MSAINPEYVFEDLEPIGFRVGPPNELSPFAYRALFEVAADAYTESLAGHRTEEAVRSMLGQNWERFRADRISPKEDTVNHESYTNPYMVIAERNPEEIVGYGIAYDNTSDTNRALRWAKMHITPQRHAFIREVAVRPGEPKGVGRVIGSLLLNNFNEAQPVVARTLAEAEAATRYAAALGLTEDDSDTGYITAFGGYSALAMRCTWRAKSVGAAQNYIQASLAVQEIISSKRDHLQYF